MGGRGVRVFGFGAEGFRFQGSGYIPLSSRLRVSGFGFRAALTVIVMMNCWCQEPATCNLPPGHLRSEDLRALGLLGENSEAVQAGHA